jgi:hypothetical protein
MELLANYFLAVTFIFVAAVLGMMVVPREHMIALATLGTFVLVCLVAIVGWLARLLRARAPAAAWYVGQSFFWLCIALSFISFGGASVAIYQGAPIILVWFELLILVLYVTAGVGLRRILVRS